MITRSGTRRLAALTPTATQAFGRPPNKPVATRAAVTLRRIDRAARPSAPQETPAGVLSECTERDGAVHACEISTHNVSQAVTAESLLRRRDVLPENHPDRTTIRLRVIEENLSMAHRLARRYRGRGESYDDLAQAAALALVKAVDGYDPHRENLFTSYAIPTITGSLKRYFRDTGWAIRVSRSAQELGRKVGDATDLLSQQLGRTPTPEEVARHLHVAVGDVVAATAARNAYRLTSLDTFHTTGGHDGADLASRLGAADPAYERIDNTLSLRPLVGALPARLQRILALRFEDELTQSEIATEIGLSQMHVSRLLKQAIQLLHKGLTAQ